MTTTLYTTTARLTSPFLAKVLIYLKQLDEQMAELDVFYARFMDDWVILAPTR